MKTQEKNMQNVEKHQLKIIFEELKRQRFFEKKSEFAKAIGITPTYLSTIFRRKATIPPKVVFFLKNKYNINPDFTEFGVGGIFLTKEEKENSDIAMNKLNFNELLKENKFLKNENYQLKSKIIELQSKLLCFYENKFNKEPTE